MILKTKKYMETNPFCYCFEWGFPRKGMRDNNPNKVRLPLCLFLRQYAGSQNLHYWHFFVRTRKFIMCKRAFYETSPKIGPDRCDTFALLSLSFLYLGFDNVLGHCWGNLNWYQTKGDKILKTLMNEKNWINVQHGFSASKMVFFNANKRGDTFVLQ